MNTSQPLGQLLVTVREAAKMLAISERTLWALTDRSEIGAVRIGRSVRYAVAELQAYIERQQGKAA